MKADKVTSLDGYRAAAVMVETFLKYAEKNRPRRGAFGDRRRAAYREGYYMGLLFAHSMHVFGDFPSKNETPIRTILSQDERSKHGQ